MATVQTQLLRLALRMDPRTKINQLFQDVSASVNVTAMANNGSGLIRVTTATAHNLQTNDQGYIIGVAGTTEANNTLTNPNWTVTRISPTVLDLQGSAFVNAWVSGGTLVGALIGTVDGNISRQRLLDIYNESRINLAGFVFQKYGRKAALKMIEGVVVVNTTINFSGGAATKPQGFIEEVLLRDPTGGTVSIVDAIALPSVQDYDNVNTKFVYDGGNQFLGQSATVIVDGAYKLWYYGVTDFTLTDVIGGTVVETFDTDWQPRIIDYAVATILEQGSVSPLALAEKMFSGVKAQ